MKIIADENIPFVKDVFSVFGEVVLSSGRNINRGMLKDADALLVRSITKVNEELLADTAVKFAATATIGIDHIDTEYLSKAGICFASAPGSNADSVAEYVVTAVSIVADKYCFDLNGKKIGIIGAGNVGSRVEKRSKVLGMIPLLNDPPKKRETNDDKYLPLDQVLSEADIVTVHVPLNKEGMDKTYHLVDSEFIKMMKNEAVLINTSRGKVHDENVVKLMRDKLRGLVLDVWENEPEIDIDSLNVTDIATPHIAGYSFDGKVNGTFMILDAFTSFFSLDNKIDKKPYLKSDSILTTINLTDSSNAVFDAVTKAYALIKDDENMRNIINVPADERKNYFDKLRKNYPVRREFKNFTAICNADIQGDIKAKLEGLGFKVKLK